MQQARQRDYTTTTNLRRYTNNHRKAVEMDEDVFESWIKCELGAGVDLSKDSSGMYADSAV